MKNTISSSSNNTPRKVQSGKTSSKKQNKTKLKDLLKKVTPENTHELVDWGDPVGKEIW